MLETAGLSGGDAMMMSERWPWDIHSYLDRGVGAGAAGPRARFCSNRD